MDEHEVHERRWPRRLLLGMVLALVLVVGAVVLAVFYLHTVIGRAQIADVATRLLSERLTHDVQVQGITGLLPFDMRVERVAISDADGDWLILEDLHLRMRSLPLIQRAVHINTLSAERITVLRRPSTEPPEEARTWTVPEFPSLPTWLTIEHLGTETLILEEPVLDERAHFALTGRFLPDHGVEGWETALALERRDAPTTQVNLHLAKADGVLSVTARVDDSAFLPAMMDAQGPVQLSLDGTGLSDAWDGSFNGVIAGEQVASGDFTLRGEAPVAITGDVRAALDHDALPPLLAERLGATADLVLRAELSEAGELQIESLNLTSPDAELAVRGLLQLEADSMDLEITADHRDAGQLLPEQEALAGQPMHLALQLAGPLQSLDVGLDALLGGEQLLAGQVHLDMNEGIAATGTLRLKPPAAMVPEQFAGLVETPLDVRLDVHYTPERVIQVQLFEARLEALALDVTGQFDLDAERVALNLVLRGDELRRFEAVLNQEINGALVLRAQVQGDAEATRAQTVISAAGLAYDEFRAGQVTADLDFRLGPWPGGLAEQVAVTGSGEIAELRLHPELSRDVSFEIDAASEDFETFLIRTLRLTDDNVLLTAEGTVQREGPRADMNLALDVREVRELAVLFDQDYAGSLSATASLDSDGLVDAIQGTLSAVYSNPRGLPDAVQELTGERLALDARFTLADDLLQVQEAQLEAAGLSGSAEGSYGLETQQIDMRTRLAVAEVAGLLPGEDPALQGGFTVDATIQGPHDNFDVQGELVSEGVRAPQFAADSARIRFQFAGLPGTIAGDIEATAVTAGQQFDLDTRLLVDLPEIALEDFVLHSAENRATGGLRFNTETRLGEGAIEARLDNLHTLGLLFNQDLGGSLHAELLLNQVANEQHLIANATATNLRAGAVAAEQVELAANLRAPFDQPAGELTLNVATLEAGGAHIRTVSLTADGTRDALRVALDADGMLREELPFRTALEADLAPEARTASLRRLEGRVEDIDFSLVEPATLALTDTGLQLSPLLLDAGGGRLELAGMYDANAADLRGSWRDMPLALGAVFGAPPLRGHTEGTIELSGPSSAPVAELRARLVQARAIAAPPEAPPLDIEIEATLAQGAFDARASLEVPDAAGMRASVGAPVQFALAPFQFEVPETGALTGQVDGEADLAAIPLLLGMEEHLMQGAFTANLGISGTVGQPIFAGDSQIRNGRYENVSSGTILDEMEVDISADRTVLRVVRFEATDASDGRVQGEGVLTLNAAADFPYELDLTLDEMRVMRRDDLTAVATGELALTGTRLGATLAGEITPSPVTYRLPERLPARRLQSIEVRERNAHLLEPLVPAPDPPRILVYPPRPDDEPEERATAFSVDFDVQATIPGQVFVRSRGLMTEWRGNLRVHGDLGNPRLTGDLNIARGYVEILDRRFDFEEGTLTFAGASPPAPHINVAASARAGEVVARLRLLGRVDSLALEMSSDPPLPEDEILAYILFGRDLSRVGPAQALRVVRYAAMFAGEFDALDLIGGPDPIIGTESFDILGAALGDSLFQIGDYIDQNIYVEFEPGVAGEGSRARVEIELMPEVSLRGEQTADGQSRVGLFWRRHY